MFQMIKLTCASRRLSPDFFKIGRAGELLGQNRPQEQADQKSCNEKIVKVFSQHIERLRRCQRCHRFDVIQGTEMGRVELCAAYELIDPVTV